MPIKGDLGSIDLAHVFQLLTLKEEAGVLEVFADGVRHLLYFGPKQVSYPYEPRTFLEKVAHLLRRAQKVSADQVTRARAAAEASNIDLLQALVQIEAVSEADVTRALREQTEEEIYELFVANDASFEFREGELPPPDRVVDERCVLSSNALVLEAARRIDDWSYIRKLVPNDGEIYEPVAPLIEVHEEEHDEVLENIYNSCDGIRTVAVIVEETHVPRYTVCKKLAVLVEQGILAPVPPEMLLERASACMHTERIHDAIRLYERAISLGCTDPALLEMAGLAYQSLLEHRKAARQYSQLADAAEATGQLKTAVEMHLRIRELLPVEINSRLKLLEIEARAPELLKPFQYDVLVETIEVALILREVGRGEESTKLLRETMNRFVQQTPAALRLADLAIELGDQRSAVETLLSVGERLVQRSDPHSALRLYRRVKAMDPSHPTVSHRMQALQARVEGGQRKQRRRIGGLAVAACLLLAVAGYGYYSKQAVDAYRATTATGVTEGNYAAAIARFEQYRRNYPFTFWSFLAREKVNDLVLEQKRKLVVERDQKQLKSAETKATQDKAESLLAEAKRHLLADQPERGLELLHKVKEQSVDAAWLQQEKVDELIASLEKYFADARQMFEHAQELRAMGELRGAHAQLKELKTKFPLSPEAVHLLLPVRIDSEPSGATFSIATLDWSVATTPPASLPAAPQVTPSVVELPASGMFNIEVRQAGFAPEVRRINPLETTDVTVKLRKAPALTVATGIPCTYLQTIEDRLLVASADGRLHLFEPASSSRKWQAAFPEMEDLISGPVSLKGVIWLLSRRGTLASFDAESGSLTSTRSLGAAAVVGPVVLNDRFGILLSSKLMVMDAQGHELFAQTLRTKPRALMAGADAFLLWSDPFELNVLRASDGETLSSFNLPENTCCVVGLSSGNVAAGTSSGEVAVFAPTGERLFSSVVETGQAVNRIVEVGDALLVSCPANSLVSLGIDQGQRLGSYTDAEPLRGWVAEAGHNILVANRASRVIELSAPSLIQLDEYAVTGHLTGAGARVGARTFFGSDDGQLYAFQTSR